MRTVVVLTKRCSLRCPYCIVGKSDEDMPPDIADKAVRLALSSNDPVAEFHYFGGEPLLRKEELIRASELAAKTAPQTVANLGFVVSTNCLGVDGAFADWAASRHVTFELSLDGSHIAAPMIQNTKPGAWAEAAKNAEMILSRGIPCFATAVVTPDTVEYLFDNICDLHALGIRNVNISPATGVMWPAAAATRFAEQLWRLHGDIFATGKMKLLNLENKTDEMLFNRELSVDCDGTIYAGNAFLFSPADIAEKFALGNVDENKPVSFYLEKAPPASFFIENVFPGDITLSYYRMVRIFQSYRNYFHSHPASEATNVANEQTTQTE